MRRSIGRAVARLVRVSLLGVALLAGGRVHGAMAFYYTFGDYDAAVGSDHDLMVDFETDRDGNALNYPVGGVFSIGGGAFSYQVTYDSPSAPSPLVNIGNIGNVQPSVRHEIGPFPDWSNRLRWRHAGLYRATGFYGVEAEPDAVIALLRGGQVVGQAALGGDFDLVRFIGVVSDAPFDEVVLDGQFYAIDRHHATAASSSSIPEPGSLALIVAGLAALRRQRRRHRATMQHFGV